MKSSLSIMRLTLALLLAGTCAAAVVRAEDAPAAGGAAEQKQEENDAEKGLLGIGQIPADFTLPLVGGGEVSLANTLKLNKAVLVGFWAIKPERGGAEMAKLQKLHEQLESKGLSTIAINPADELPEVSKFVETAKVQFLVAVDGKETNRAVTNVYRAKTLPTFYLLDPEGKILWRSVGLKEAALRETLEKAGVK